MILLLDRYFLVHPLVRQILIKLLARNREENVTLLSTDSLVHTVREHGFFRVEQLAQTCRLFRDETPGIPA
jgi:hypothetical protein